MKYRGFFIRLDGSASILASFSLSLLASLTCAGAAFSQQPPSRTPLQAYGVPPAIEEYSCSLQASRPTVRACEDSVEYKKGELAQLDVLKGLLNPNDYRRRKLDLQQKLTEFQRVLDILKVRNPDQ